VAQAQETSLTGLLICADPALAGEFRRAAQQARVFDLLGVVDRYPSSQALQLRLRQLQPEVVVLDVATNFEEARRLMRFIRESLEGPHIVAIHRQAVPELVVRVLREGAAEFLAAPFPVQEQREAAARILRLVRPQRPASEPVPGKLLAFSSAKPGCGASTLALYTAHALTQVQPGRVLVVDLDLASGVLAFCTKCSAARSVVDALALAAQMSPALWESCIQHWHGLDLLPAPAVAEASLTAVAELHDLFEFARLHYAWIVVDSPVILHRTALLASSESDATFLVTTSELASLHLARRAITALEQLGFDRSRFQVVVNRYRRQDSLRREDLEKVLNLPVVAILPSDYLSVHQAVSLGEPLAPASLLAKSVAGFARSLVEGRAGANARAA